MLGTVHAASKISQPSCLGGYNTVGFRNEDIEVLRGK